MKELDQLEAQLATLRWCEPPAEDGRDVDDGERQDRFIGGWQFIQQHAQTARAIWGQDDEVLWSHGESLVIVGGQGAGKSTIAQQLTLHLLGLRRSNFLGLPVAEAERVLYLAMDRPSQIARSLHRMVTERDAAVLDSRLVVWQGPPPKDMARRTELLAEMAIRQSATVVIVDSLKDAAIKLTDDEVGSQINRAFQTALQAGVNVVVLHHHRKIGAGQAHAPESLDEVYGSTWVTAGAGSVISLAAQPGGEFVKVKHLKQPMTEVGPLTVQHQHARGLSVLVDPTYEYEDV